MIEPAKGNLYGLFVGINRYESEDIRPLAFASADVLAVRDTLADRFNLKYENTVLLADDTEGGLAPTRRQILRAMDRFASAPMKQEDSFLLVFAGHGFFRAGRTYLAASDSEIASETLLRETAVSLDTVRGFLEQIAAGQQILILDACRDAPLRGTRSVGSEAMSPDMTRDIGAVIHAQRPSRPGGLRARAVLCSCWEGQIAHEYAQGGHGWFCHNLLAELHERVESELPLSDLHRQVKERMRESAWRLLPAAKNQTPHLEVLGDVPVLRAQMGAPRPESKPSSVAMSPAPVGLSGAAQEGPPAVAASGCEPEFASIEKAIRAGRADMALRALKKRSDASATGDMLECIARLARQPIRKLNHKEADFICGLLAGLSESQWSSLARYLARLMADRYYRPLRRRLVPSLARLNGLEPVKGSLSPRERELVMVVEEAAQDLSNA